VTTYFLRYEFQSELSRDQLDVIDDVLGIRVTGVRDEWKDTPGSVRLDEETTLYLERTADDGVWWFTLTGSGTTPEQLVGETQGRLEAVLERISPSWRRVRQVGLA